MLREALRSAGYKIWEAGNGAEAIGQWGARIDEVDLVVTDIVMPVMNGLILADELRARRRDIKVVFMSGHSMDVINNQSVPDPAPDLLQKPFMPQVLVRKVREVLDQVPNPAHAARDCSARVVSPTPGNSHRTEASHLLAGSVQRAKGSL